MLNFGIDLSSLFIWFDDNCAVVEIEGMAFSFEGSEFDILKVP
jgi:hypothetical protein